MMASFPAVTDSETKPTTLLHHPPEQPAGLNCPRCHSPNTKFCYFNNYSLTQPRHFCKTCRRYWTKGGALRNVPVGGGCRKNKRRSSSLSASSSSSSSSRFQLDPFDPVAPDNTGGVLFGGQSSALPSMDFQLGLLPFYGGSSTTSMVGMGLNHPFSSGAYTEMGGASVSSTLASSIESLSSINQDLHLKLQQQRMAVFFGGGGQKDSSLPPLPPPLVDDHHHQHQQQQQQQQQHEEISFQASDGTQKGTTGATTAWFLESPCTTMPFANPSNNGCESNTGNWGVGFQAWGDMQQFNSS